MDVGSRVMQEQLPNSDRDNVWNKLSRVVDRFVGTTPWREEVEQCLEQLPSKSEQRSVAKLAPKGRCTQLHGSRYPLEGCAGGRAMQDAYTDVGGRTAPGASSRAIAEEVHRSALDTSANQAKWID